MVQITDGKKKIQILKKLQKHLTSRNLLTCVWRNISVSTCKYWLCDWFWQFIYELIQIKPTKWCITLNSPQEQHGTHQRNPRGEVLLFQGLHMLFAYLFCFLIRISMYLSVLDIREEDTSGGGGGGRLHTAVSPVGAGLSIPFTLQCSARPWGAQAAPQAHRNTQFTFAKCNYYQKRS